eukprot:3867616-Rhodomonas_salina.2
MDSLAADRLQRLIRITEILSLEKCFQIALCQHTPHHENQSCCLQDWIAEPATFQTQSTSCYECGTT